MEIVKSLNLNKVPQQVENNSLVCAKNIKISSDGTYITNEEGIKSIYSVNDSASKIVGVIACNTELVIFQHNVTTNESSIVLYDEKTNTSNIVECDWKWNNGEVFGTYTKNVKDEIIVAVSERNTSTFVPLKIINVSINTKTGNENKYTLAPDVPNVFFEFEEYILGNYIPNGVYYFYIRYYIDEYNKTGWYPCSNPILTYNIDKKEVISYTRPNIAYYIDGSVRMKISGDGADSKINNYTGVINTSKSYNNNKNFKLNIIKNNINNYSKFEVGVIISTKDSVKSYVWQSFDINVNFIIFDGSNMIETNIDDLKNSLFNLYNVQTMDNYGNRLYVADYYEGINSLVDYDTNNINVIFTNDKTFDFSNTEQVIYKADVWCKNYSGGIAVRRTYTIQNRGFNFGNGVVYHKCQRLIDCYNATTYNPKLGDKDNCYVKNPLTNQEVECYLGDVYIISDDYYTGPDHVGSGKLIAYPKGIPIPFVSDQYVKYKDNSLTLNCVDIRFTRPTEHIITDTKDFNIDEQIINKTLIAGEVYNFFVHFVKLDGTVSKGYRISNNEEYIVLPPIIATTGYTKNICAKYNDNLSTVYSGIKKFCDDNSFDIETISNYKNLINYFIKYGDYKVYQLFGDSAFTSGSYLNIVSYYTEGVTTNVNLTYKGYTPYSNIYNEKMFLVCTPNDNKSYSFKTIIPKFNNIIIPNGYDGYFISYEKLESRIKIRGIGTLNDYTGKETSNTDKLPLRINSNDLFDTNITNISGNALQIIGRVKYNSSWRIGSGYNRIINSYENINAFIPINNINIIAPNNVEDDNIGRESAIIINKNAEFVKEDYKFNNDYHTYIIVNILNTSNTLYSNRSKILIPMTKIVFSSNSYICDNKDNLGGYVTLNNLVTYNKRGVNINTNAAILSPSDGSADTYYYFFNNFDRSSGLSYIEEQPFAVVQFPTYNKTLYELIEDKNIDYAFSSNVESWRTKDASGYEFVSLQTFTQRLPNGTQLSKLFEITDNFDVFKSIKIYDNYTGKEINIERYKRWIRRSDVQQSESYTIAWRNFSPNNYKQITENKGNIKNIVGVGLYLLVHTEHSLFMFNRDASLKTQDKDVQLVIPDAFDTDYQEVFTSDKGYGGLQNYTSWIVNEYGYTFYDSDAKIIYNFDNGSLKALSNNINTLMQNLDIDNVTIGYDFKNNRTIYCIKTTDYKYITLSYNYLVNKWISLHDYNFDNAYRTKTNIYLSSNKNIYTFDKNTVCVFGDLQNKDNTLFPVYLSDRGDISYSYLDVICNEAYTHAKSLEFISYVLSEIVDYFSHINQAEECSNKRYSGYQCIIYTDSTYSGLLDINTANLKNQFNNYKYPYFDKGKWNFNYFRNYVERPNADLRSLIYGKYIVIRFIFNNDSGIKFKLEDVDFKVRSYE